MVYIGYYLKFGCLFPCRSRPHHTREGQTWRLEVELGPIVRRRVKLSGTA